MLLNNLELADGAPRRLWDAALYELHKRLIASVAALVDLRASELINKGKDIKASEVFFEPGSYLQTSKTPLDLLR